MRDGDNGLRHDFARHPGDTDVTLNIDTEFEVIGILPIACRVTGHQPLTEFVVPNVISKFRIRLENVDGIIEIPGRDTFTRLVEIETTEGRYFLGFEVDGGVHLDTSRQRSNFA